MLKQRIFLGELSSTQNGYFSLFALSGGTVGLLYRRSNQFMTLYNLQACPKLDIDNCITCRNHLVSHNMYCMPQRVGQHHIISCAEPCKATQFLHLLDNVDSALEAIRFGNFLALLAGNIGLSVFAGAFW